MDKVKLTPRLLAAARLAGESRFAVDVGTDHGRLAVWLLQNEKAARVAATDIRTGPLSSARPPPRNTAWRTPYVLSSAMSGLLRRGGG